MRKYIKIAYEDIQKFGINNIVHPGKPNSLDITVHLSWDYAQQIQSGMVNDLVIYPKFK